MPKRISLAAHLSLEELEQSYRQATNAKESRQYQMLWLLAQGKSSQEVSQITGYSRNWLYILVRRYNELGTEGIGDHRRNNKGASPLIDDVLQAQLWQVLQDPAPDGGLWNGRKVAHWLSQVTGEEISRQRGWEILRQMTFRLRVPRPSHTDADPVAQEDWKKNSKLS